MGNESKKVDSDKTNHQEMKQNDKYSGHGERKSKDNKQKEESEEDKTEVITEPIKGKNTRDQTTESEASGFNFDSETEGDSEETSKKGRNKAKRKRIVVDMDILESKTKSFEKKIIKNKKGKAIGKKNQRKNTKRENIKDISHVVIDSEEEVEEIKKDEGRDKDGEENLEMGNIEGLNTTSL
ncbi:uncharacterized protein LOC131859142 [Cryptomeria japonica]|uniref:uncharacterized protein LOC131859142 n=1 Tax=Cryptomeria japonica TaxID=3369 RepID=UPI0027D9F2E5|nr:uncharacterized protein LOC131859142 [Cryptomeria japonica]